MPLARVFEPYFASHADRNTYVSLLQKTDPPAHDALLKSALIRRAMTDVNRVIRLREDKPALQILLQKGSIGDDLWNSVLAAEKELEAEIMEVVAEANTFVDGWGSVIFQTASEMIANEKMRNLFDQTTESRAEKGLCIRCGGIISACSHLLLERIYERKTKPTGVPSISLLSPGVPNSPAQPVTPSNSPASGKSAVTNGITALPSSRLTANDLSTSHSTGVESATSSDGEALASPLTSATNSPRTSRTVSQIP